MRIPIGYCACIAFHGQVKSRIVILNGINKFTDIDLNLKFLTNLTTERILRTLPWLNFSARKFRTRPLFRIPLLTADFQRFC